MKKLSVLFLLALMLVGCTRPEYARHVLEDQGYKDVHITGYAWFACSEDDTFHTAFTATGPTGRTVSGAVCSSLLIKNATIRFD